MVSSSFIKPYLSCSLYLFYFSYIYFTLRSVKHHFTNQQTGFIHKSDDLCVFSSACDIIITTTEVVVCTDPRRVITGLAPKGALKVWHRITITGRR